MTDFTVSSEMAKRDLTQLIDKLSEGVVYIKDGTNFPCIKLRKFVTEDDQLSDYFMSVTEARTNWTSIKLAIYAYHTEFCITHRGVPVAVMLPSEYMHPVRNYYDNKGG